MIQGSPNTLKGRYPINPREKRGLSRLGPL